MKIYINCLEKVAIDASLIIYQNLLNIGNRPYLKIKGKITNFVWIIL